MTRRPFTPALTLPLLLLALTGCAQTTSATTEDQVAVNPIGHYVTEGYAQRDQGHDWLSVSVSQSADQQLAITVRGRNDQKKPSCTFDGLAQAIDTNTYQAMANGQAINFTVSPQELVISAPTPEALPQLSYYCSGGASLGGAYQKIDGDLDRSHLDKTPFKANT